MAADGEVEDYSVQIQFSNGEIRGTKFNDLDGDGVLDAGEPALSGWTMTLYAGNGCGGDAVDEGVTDGAGNVTFHTADGSLGWAEDAPYEIKSTQTEEIEQDPEERGVAVKEQKITTDPKMAGNEKTASAQGWWFDHI